jgi:DNA-binding NarL/FixJ family response regulator
MPNRVVLAEDNLLVREGVRRLLETRREIAIEVLMRARKLGLLAG